MQDNINAQYFNWLCNIIGSERCFGYVSFNKLLERLHDITFTYCLPRDGNRAENGVSLRYEFALAEGYPDVPECLDGPCSVLEMMVALAIRCEGIMDDPTVGDRTGQWFWRMVTNLGLGAMIDDKFDSDFVDDVILKFLNREYEPDGKGGLFRIRNCEFDLRDVEIWHQLCWYLDTIVV